MAESAVVANSACPQLDSLLPGIFCDHLQLASVDFGKSEHCHNMDLCGIVFCLYLLSTWPLGPELMW